MSRLQDLVLQTLSKLDFLGRERIVWAADAGSAGAGDVVGVVKAGEVGSGLGDGLGVGRLPLVLDAERLEATHGIFLTPC